MGSSPGAIILIFGRQFRTKEINQEPEKSKQGEVYFSKSQASFAFSHPILVVSSKQSEICFVPIVYTLPS